MRRARRPGQLTGDGNKKISTVNIKLVLVSGLFLIQGFAALYQMAARTGTKDIYIPLDAIAVLIGIGLLLRFRLAQICGVVFATMFLILSTATVFFTLSLYSVIFFSHCIWVIYALFSRDLREELR